MNTCGGCRVQHATILADTNSSAAVWAAFGAIAAAVISGGLAYLTNRKRNPNALMDTFIREVGADNDRLREENEKYAGAIEGLRKDMRAMKRDCDTEIQAIRDESSKREAQLKQEIFDLQLKVYNLEKGLS